MEEGYSKGRKRARKRSGKKKKEIKDNDRRVVEECCKNRKQKRRLKEVKEGRKYEREQIARKGRRIEEKK